MNILRTVGRNIHSSLKSHILPCQTSASKINHACYSTGELKDIEFDELSEKVKDKKVTLIDCRLPQEVNELGVIPGSVVLPLQTMGNLLVKNDNEFEEILGVKKPPKDAEIVTLCKLGIRARTAQLALLGAGYSNVRVYVGSYDDWTAKGGDTEVPNPAIKLVY